MGVPGPTWVRRRFFSGLSTPDLAAVLLRLADCYWNFPPRQRRLWRGCRRIALLDRAMEHSTRNGKAVPPVGQPGFSAVIPQREDDMSPAIEKIMRTPAGFKKDMQFEMETLKEHDAPGGAGQIVRGVHMRLHAGSHVDAPEHNVRGGTQIHQLPLELFIGDAVVADLRDKMPGKAITENDLERAVGARIRKGDRLLLRTDHNNAYDGGSDKWMKASPYLTIGATDWCIGKGVVIVGYDFYHGNDEPGAPRVFHNSRTLSEHGIVTMPYLKNLDRITKDRVTLIGFPLNIIGAEASPVRAVVLT
jgi:kynurenine formamidase